MANSKHAHLRYNILDNCFRKRSYSFDELLEVLNRVLEENYPNESISIRTLRDDLKVFRDQKSGFGAPLPEKARKLQYSDVNFSIAQKPLLKYEQYLIEAAQQLLERFENDPKYDKLAEALIKFQDEENQQENDSSKVLFYDHNEEYKGIKLLKPLYLAIKNKHVLQITFQGFKNDSALSYEFHPQILKQYNRRWFVFGINKTKGITEWSIPLDERLLGFEILKDIPYLKSNLNWTSYFRSIVGVVKPANSKEEKVVLRFYNGREEYFKTKPFHPDFEEYFDENKNDQVWFNTIINRELVQQILSYGQDVQVLEPKSLLNEIQNHLVSMQDYYDI